MSFEPVLAFSLPGLKHRAAGAPGQDAVSWSSSPHLFAGALADGIGSRENSHVGALVATRSGVHAALAAHSTYPDLLDLARHAVIEATKAVTAEAGAMGLTSDCLACTYALILADAKHVLLAIVGDGVTFVRFNDGTVVEVLPVPNKDFANFTDSLTTSDLTEVTRFASFAVDDIDAVLTSSDGLEPVLCRGPLFAQRPTGLVNRLLDAPRLQGWSREELEAMGRSPSITAATHDDLSLMCVHLRGDHAGEEAELEGGGTVHLAEDGATTWPTGARAVHASERGGLVVVETPGLTTDQLGRLVEGPPPAIDGSALAWPIDVVVHPRWPSAVLVRPWGTALPDPFASRAQVADCVRSLHDAGFAHGALSDDLFAVDGYGQVQLRECTSALRSKDVDGRRKADEQYLLALEQRASVASVGP